MKIDNYMKGNAAQVKKNKRLILLLFILGFFLLASCGKSSNTDQKLLLTAHGEPQGSYITDSIFSDTELSGLISLSCLNDKIYAVQYDRTNHNILEINTSDDMQITSRYETPTKISALSAGDDGSLSFFETTETEADDHSDISVAISKINADNAEDISGSKALKYTTTLQNEIEGTVTGVNKIITDNEGRAFVHWYLSNKDHRVIENRITALSESGDILFTVSSENISDIACSSSGDIYVLLQDDSICSIDLSKQSLSDALYQFEEPFFGISSGTQDSLILTDGKSLYELNLESSELSPLINWTNQGIPQNPGCFDITDEGTVYVSSGEDLYVLKEGTTDDDRKCA